MSKNKDIIIYQSGEIELKVSVENETIWLNTEDIANLFDVQRPAVVKHIGNIYKINELPKNSTCSILEQVEFDLFRNQARYNNFVLSPQHMKILLNDNSLKVIENE